MDGAIDGAQDPGRDVVAMCYVVVTGEPGFTARDLRVRFEFRRDVADPRNVTRMVRGVDAACDALRAWLESVELW
jgi:hypothetical protein